MRIKYKNPGFSLLILFSVVCLNSSLVAQDVNSSANQQVERSKDNSGEFNRNEYRGRISDDYLTEFTTMSEGLSVKEEELESLRYRIEAVTERSKKVSAKEQQDLFKENIRTLKINEDQLESEVRLIRKALRLLQENKSEPDQIKQKVLNEIDEIKIEISNLDSKYEGEKKDVMLDGVEIDKNDVYQNPTSDGCNFAFNGFDDASKKVRREVRKQFFFGYTHPKLKNYFKDKHFLTCEANIVRNGKKNYLKLHITISSKDAKRTYGSIEQKSTLKFELIDGEVIYLQNAQNTYGSLEAYTGNTIYELILPIDKSQTKQLIKSEVDKVGMMWTSGYEQYEVYNIDLIMNQLNCVYQK